MKEPEEKTVALLHDILHETACTVEELQTADISNYSIDKILLLHEKEWESYTQYIERIKASEIARKVKIADLREHLKEECSEKYRKRYEEMLVALSKNSPSAAGEAVT